MVGQQARSRLSESEDEVQYMRQQYAAHRTAFLLKGVVLKAGSERARASGRAGDSGLTVAVPAAVRVGC